MTLREYFANNKGSMRKLAQHFSFTPGYAWQLANGVRTPSPILAIAIEKFTNGDVGRCDMRPDDWHLIWPELAEK